MVRAAEVGVWARNRTFRSVSLLVLVARPPDRGLLRPGPLIAHERSLGEWVGDVDVEVAGVGVVHRRGHVLPVVGERRRGLLGGGEDDRRPVADQLQRRAKRFHRQQRGDVRALGLIACHLRELAMLERQLGRRVELDLLGLAERALGEGREPADRLDLVAEQLQPRGAVLGRAEDVEDAAAHRELAPVLDLVGALVARLDQELGDVGEVDLLAAVEDEALAGAAAASGTASASATADATTTGCSLLVARCSAGSWLRLSTVEGVQGADAKADQVRRRRQVRLVPGPPRGVVADPSRRQVRAEGAGQVAGADVVGGDHQRRAVGERLIGIEQGGEQVRPDRARRAQVDRLAGSESGRRGRRIARRRARCRAVP